MSAPMPSPGSGAFDLPGLVRRVRRLADLSQRQLAEQAGVSQSAIARVETGTRDLPTALVAQLIAAAGLRLLIVDDQGRAITPMSADGALDRAGRHCPAHLDPHLPEPGWPAHWGAGQRYDRPPPRTRLRARARRDEDRLRDGTPEDHVTETDLTHAASLRERMRRARQKSRPARERDRLLDQ